jgi:urease accessory protein
MVHIFKSIPSVSETCRGEALPGRARAYARDTITLGWEDRMRGRARRRSDNGSEFATTLVRGTILRAGDGLVVDELELVVLVVERAEPVFVVRPTNPEEWGLFGYQIGNSHQPMMIADGAIVCADLPGMQQILEQHNIPFERAMSAFTPVGGAASHGHPV